MNVKLLTIAVLTATITMSCGNGNQVEEPKPETTEIAEATSPTYTIDAEHSSLVWRGEVAGVYGHDGVANVKGGTISVADGAITGGEITIDMSTIAATDSASYKDEDGHRISNLEGHLTTSEFFSTEKFPTATFVVTNVDGSTITGDLTVRGKTNSEKFNVESTEILDESVTVSGKLKFDRQKYDVAWVHYMKDMVLSNDISLTISVTATK
ncbi:MAG: polyisoprenoid-binding protein YceI [Saprospiraceae bacterium]|jgi:polyisoprenoid-binding protein YceI